MYHPFVTFPIRTIGTTRQARAAAQDGRGGGGDGDGGGDGGRGRHREAGRGASEGGESSDHSQSIILTRHTD